MRYSAALIGAFSALFPSETHATGFFGDHARGWHWYEAIPMPIIVQEKEKKKAKPFGQHSSAQINLDNPTVLLKQYKSLIKESFDRALVDPSPENLYTYMALQKDSMMRSHRFAHNWQHVVLHKPELDSTLQFPVNQAARHVYYTQEKETISQRIKALKDTHGLYFFFKKECPYCHEFAPAVKAFAQKHGWTVFAVSLDGGSLPEFPDAHHDNGMAARLNVTSIPALFAANPSKGQIVPIANGMISQTDIETRILLLTEGVKK